MTRFIRSTASVVGLFLLLFSSPADAVTIGTSLTLRNGFQSRIFNDPFFHQITDTNGEETWHAEGYARAHWSSYWSYTGLHAVAAGTGITYRPYGDFTPYANAIAEAFLTDEFEIRGASVSQTKIRLIARFSGTVYSSGNNAIAVITAGLGSNDISTNNRYFYSNYGLHDPSETFFLPPPDPISLHLEADIIRSADRAFVNYGLAIRAEIEAKDGLAVAAAGHTLELVRIEFLSGETPESLGYELAFSSGSVSPNLVVAQVPEPSTFALGIATLAGLVGCPWLRWRSR